VNVKRIVWPEALGEAPGPQFNLVYMKIGNQWIKRFAFCDSAQAGIGSLPADEELHRSHCRRVGGLICSGRIEDRNCGGHRDEEIKIRSQQWRAAGMEMFLMEKIALTTFKLYCIAEIDKTIFQFSQGEVA
jgi:hypothetical protein